MFNLLWFLQGLVQLIFLLLFDPGSYKTASHTPRGQAFFFLTISWIPSHGTHPPLACVAETVQPGAIRACWEGHICSSAVKGLDLIPNWPQIESGVVVRRMLISLRIISGPISPEEWLPWWLRW